MVPALAACQTSSDSNVETSLASSTHGAATDSVAPKSGSAREALLAQDKFDPNLLAKASAATGKRYFIDFRSRYALSYGHTFAVFGRLNSRGHEISSEVAGLAPKSESPAVYSMGHFIPVPSSTGWTDGDTEYEYMTAIWRIMLTKSEYDKVVADIRKLQASLPVWHAVFYNCNAFVGDIAGSMGYRATLHWLMPRDYVTNLRKVNGGPDAIGWTAPSARKPPGLS